MQELSGEMTISTFIEATIIPHPKAIGDSTKPVRYYRAMTLSEAPVNLKPTQLPATTSQAFHLNAHGSPTPAIWAELVKEIHNLLAPAATNRVECPGLLEKVCHSPAYDHVPDMLKMCSWLSDE